MAEEIGNILASIPQIKLLNDKLYEKRKLAALDIERWTREAWIGKDPGLIKLFSRYLVSEYVGSAFPNARNGGLIGLAAIAIALGSDVSAFLPELVLPVLAGFADQDSRVRYYACESMYNIAKVAKSDCLHYFNEIFDALSKVI